MPVAGGVVGVGDTVDGPVDGPVVGVGDSVADAFVGIGDAGGGVVVGAADSVEDSLVAVVFEPLPAIPGGRTGGVRRVAKGIAREGVESGGCADADTAEADELLVPLEEAAGSLVGGVGGVFDGVDAATDGGLGEKTIGESFGSRAAVYAGAMLQASASQVLDLSGNGSGRHAGTVADITRQVDTGGADVLRGCGAGGTRTIHGLGDGAGVVAEAPDDAEDTAADTRLLGGFGEGVSRDDAEGEEVGLFGGHASVVHEVHGSRQKNLVTPPHSAVSLVSCSPSSSRPPDVTAFWVSGSSWASGASARTITTSA